MEITETSLAFTTALRWANTDDLVAVLRTAARLAEADLDRICSHTTSEDPSETIEFVKCGDGSDAEPPDRPIGEGSGTVAPSPSIDSGYFRRSTPRPSVGTRPGLLLHRLRPE